MPYEYTVVERYRRRPPAPVCITGIRWRSWNTGGSKNGNRGKGGVLAMVTGCRPLRAVICACVLAGSVTFAFVQPAVAANGRTATAAADCLSSADTGLVREFKNEVRLLLEQHDTAAITECIGFPLEVETGAFIGRGEFIVSFYTTVATYFLRETMDESEAPSLERTEDFIHITGKDGCFGYQISNAFPELEFNVNFYCEKRDGRLKIVSLRIIG